MTIKRKTNVFTFIKIIYHIIYYILQVSKKRETFDVTAQLELKPTARAETWRPLLRRLLGRCLFPAKKLRKGGNTAGHRAGSSLEVVPHPCVRVVRGPTSEEPRGEPGRVPELESPRSGSSLERNGGENLWTRRFEQRIKHKIKTCRGVRTRPE